MPERDKKILKNFKSFIDDTEKILGHKINPTTGGKSANHKLNLRKRKGGKGALDLGRNDSKMTTDEKKRKVARLARRHGYRVGFEGHHLHIDDRDSATSTFTKKREKDPQLKNSKALKKQVDKDHKKEIEARGKFLFGLPKSNNIDGKSLVSLEGSINTESNQLMRTDAMGNPLESEEDRKKRLSSREVVRTDAVKNVVGNVAGSVMEQEDAQKEAQKAEILRDPFTSTQKVIASDPEGVKSVVDQVAPTKTEAKKLHKAVDNIAVGKESKSGVESKFTEALSFFLPNIIGGGIGALIGGTEGAIEGSEDAGQMRDAFLKRGDTLEAQSLERDKLEATTGKASQAQANKLRDQELRERGLDQQAEQQKKTNKFKESNLQARQKDLKLQRERNKNLEIDRDLRRSERAVERAISAKDTFAKRKDVLADKETLRQLDSLMDLADVKILPGAVGFKLAKGVAGEVGNLTNEEREAAQISPSLWRNAKRYASKTFKGEIPAEDIRDLKMASEFIRKRINGRLGKRATDFATSRGKHLNRDEARSFREDLFIESGLSMPKSSKSAKAPSQEGSKESSGGSREEYEAAILSAKTLEEIQEIKARFGVK